MEQLFFTVLELAVSRTNRKIVGNLGTKTYAEILNKFMLIVYASISLPSVTVRLGPKGQNASFVGQDTNKVVHSLLSWKIVSAGISTSR